MIPRCREEGYSKENLRPHFSLGEEWGFCFGTPSAQGNDINTISAIAGLFADDPYEREFPEGADRRASGSFLSRGAFNFPLTHL